MTTQWASRQKLHPVSRQPELDAVLDAGEVPIIVGRGLFVLAGDSVAHACSGMIDVRDHASVFAGDAAAVRACGWSLVWAGDEVHVDAYDESVVIAGDRSCVRAADRSRVIAHGLARVTALDHAVVWADADITVICEGPDAAAHRASPHERARPLDNASALVTSQPRR